MARKMGRLAHAWAKQGGKLKVRQREQLRRAFVAAADSLGWSTIIAKPVEAAIKDVRKLARVGTRSMVEELEEKLARKRSEIEELRKLQVELQEMSEDPDFEGPVELSYTCTARRSGSLVTKTDTLTLEDRKEAAKWAAKFEKKLGRWERLRDKMLDNLERRRRLLEETKENLPVFVDSSRPVLSEVFAILY